MTWRISSQSTTRAERIAAFRDRRRFTNESVAKVVSALEEGRIAGGEFNYHRMGNMVFVSEDAPRPQPPREVPA